MHRKGWLAAALVALLLGGALAYRFAHLAGGGRSGERKEEAAREAGGRDGQRGEDNAPEGVRLEPEARERSGIAVAVAQRTRLRPVIAATGKVEANADRIAHVSPRIPGKVVAVEAGLGDAVRAGQILVRLDSVELGEALAEYRKARSRVGLAKSNLERVRTLVEKKIAARKDILQAETEHETAASELHAFEERLRLYGLSPAEYENHRDERPLLLPVTSPIAGIVTEKHATVGELAEPARNLYTVADLSSVWVLVDINERDLGKVARGREAAVKVGAFPETVFRGRVTHIADLVDEATRTVKARIEVANPGRRLKPEMFASVELPGGGEAPPVVAVPAEAVQEMDGRKIVFVTEDGLLFVPREVATGSAAGDFVEIAKGLEEGEKYAAKGTFVLKAEMKKGELGEE